jgi:GDP-D-mannose dehydratase
MSKKHKVALITGITTQDGSLLVEKGCMALDIKRRASSFNAEHIENLVKNCLKE